MSDTDPDKTKQNKTADYYLVRPGGGGVEAEPPPPRAPPQQGSPLLPLQRSSLSLVELNGCIVVFMHHDYRSCFIDM